jgi:TetR/AcrR family transcriptional regulator, regulator of autoinduction and epiphytic fitness
VTAPQSAAGVAPARLSFKAQMLQAREDAIVQAANRLLAEKGFDLMTVDQLAAAAMVRVLGVALDYLVSLPAGPAPVEQLKSVVRWMLKMQFAGDMPSLPSQNSSLRAALMNNRAYLDTLMQVSDRIGGWIEAAQQDGSLNAQLPPALILYTLYARACDPVPQFLKASGQHTDEEIIELVISTCFNGINAG